MGKTKEMYMDKKEASIVLSEKFICPECKKENSPIRDGDLTDGQECEYSAGFRLCSKCGWYGQNDELKTFLIDNNQIQKGKCPSCEDYNIKFHKDTNQVKCNTCGWISPHYLHDGFNTFRKPKIYMAGKIGVNDWRHSLVSELRGHNYWEFYKDQNPSLLNYIRFNDNLIYTGPFFISCDHGCSHGGSTHGAGKSECSLDFPSKEVIFQACKNQISDSDYIFCWIDSLDCYGTLFELGIAHEKGKKIFIGIDEKLKTITSPICECGTDFSDRPNEVGKGCCHSGPTTTPDDLWFVRNSGESNYYKSLKDAWNEFLDWGPMKINEKEKEDFVKTLNTQELEDFEDIKNKQPMSKTINYFKRNRQIVGELKKLYDGKCQICQETFEKEDGSNYCETHHVKALGKNGTDTIDNLVVLCPTCHKKLHFAKEKEFDIKYKEEHYMLMEVTNDNKG